MKKIIILIAALAISAAAANAQIWVSAGYNSVTERISGTNSHYDGFSIGAESEHKLFLFTSFVHGLKLNAYYGSANAHNYSYYGLSIPVLIRGNFPIIPGYLGTYAQIGPDFGLGLSCKEKESVSNGNSFDYYKEGYYQRFRMGLDVGVGFTYKQNFRISFDYNFGLNNLSKIDSKNAKMSYFTVGIARKF